MNFKNVAPQWEALFPNNVSDRPALQVIASEELDILTVNPPEKGNMPKVRVLHINKDDDVSYFGRAANW